MTNHRRRSSAGLLQPNGAGWYSPPFFADGATGYCALAILAPPERLASPMAVK